MVNNDFHAESIELATELTIAWLSNANTRASTEEIPAFLRTMHEVVVTLRNGSPSIEEPAAVPEFTAAVTVRRSLASKDHIISMIDGKPYKTLKRHLSTHGLTPAQYRDRYGLKADYPMVAENYAEMRRGFAKRIGLGRKPGTKVPAKTTAKPEAKVTKPRVVRTKKAVEASSTPPA